MKFHHAVLAVVLVLFSMSAKASGNLVVRDDNGNSATITQEPCVISPWLKDWKQGTLVYGGKTYATCWRLIGETVFILDSAGDVSPIQARYFKPETKI